MKVNVVSKLGLVLCAALATSVVLAQKPPTGGSQMKGGGMTRQGGPGGMRGGGGQKYFDQLAKDLGLTAAQKTKIQALMEKQREKRRAAFKSSGGPQQGRPTEAQMKAMRQQMEKMQAEMDKEMKKILTAAQFKKYTDIRAKREAEMRKRFQAGGGGTMMRGGAPRQGGGKGG